MGHKTRAIIVAVLLGFGGAASSAEVGPAARNPVMVEQEISLAKSAGIYAVLDLGLKSLELKTRGMTLKRWEVVRSRSWGRAVEPRVYKILKRSTLFPPKRTNITPTPGEEPKDVELGVLELSKMPTHFSINFEEGVRLKVRPKTKNVFKWLRNVGAAIVWYGFLPYKTVWRSVSKKPFTEIEIVAKSEQDARAIYWSFYENLNAVIGK